MFLKRAIEALRGSARPGRGTPRTQNVLAQGQSEAYGDSKPDNTSSTAQGGGGSFKNRKPIGEVGCCESGMAERSH